MKKEKGQERAVTCVNNKQNGLVLGQKYIFSHEEVISGPRIGGTYITIGDKNFHKEDFIEDRYCTPKLQGILQVCASKGYVIEKLGKVDTGFFAPKQLKLILAQRSEVVLTKEQLNTLQDGEILTIGREKSPFCNVAPQNIDLHVSSIHCFLQKTAEGIQVYDCSANGTTASLSFDNRVFKKI